MRRLASAFLTLWLLFFVPCLIVWVLVVRSSSAGVERYASVWNWVGNRMAYPLVLSPPDRSVVARPRTEGCVGRDDTSARRDARPRAVLHKSQIEQRGDGAEHVALCASVVPRNATPS